MDAHRNSNKVATLLPEQAESVEGTEDTTPEAVRRLARRLQRLAPGEVRGCYEAGPTGYALQRQLRAAGATEERASQRVRARTHTTIIVPVSR
jgi:hypothetical protein